MNPKLPLLRDKVKTMPLDSGVYIMRDVSRKIIYVGKAKQLRIRVGSYFRSVEKHDEKTYRLVSNIDDFDYIVTASEFEALVLEASLIKLHKPKYNILLKDDKGYHYIKFSAGDFPRITAERMTEETGRFLGPFTSSYVVKETVEEVNKAFLLPTCKKKFPEDFHKGRPCLNYHIKRCMGLCRGRIGTAEYADTMRHCEEFIKGGGKSTVALMTTQMEEAAERLDFEKAASLRDRIRAITRVTEQQRVMFTKEINLDVVALCRDAASSAESGGAVSNVMATSAVIIKIRDHRLVDKLNFDLGDVSALEAARGEFIISYYNNDNEIPKRIALDGECEDAELISRFLSEKADHKVEILVPERGEKLRLVKMAATNAAEQLARKSERTNKELSALEELARLLGLAHPPAYIEAYDISNMGEETVVGGMVAFENGRPLKSAYRKFNIKTVVGTDDYASMREVINRRLSHYEEEKETGKGFGRLPDLILLDGGKGHVSAVEPLVEEMGFSIPVFGMVKDDKHRTRAIAQDGGEISILSTRSAFTLVSGIQDEVHRFSITHMQARRKKTAFALRLESVEGVGPKRSQALFGHFKTQTAMKAASQAELAAVPGMTKAAAKQVYAYFHGEEEEPRLDFE